MRNMMKYLIETLNEENLIKHFCTFQTNENDNKFESGPATIENLLNSLIEVLVDVKLK